MDKIAKLLSEYVCSSALNVGMAYRGVSLSLHNVPHIKDILSQNVYTM